MKLASQAQAVSALRKQVLATLKARAMTISVRELSLTSGVHERTIYRLLNGGGIQATSLKAIARALKIGLARMRRA